MAIDRFEVLSQLTKREFPRFSIRDRSSTWLRLFMGNSTATTIGSTVYTDPSIWADLTSDQRYKVLRHEKVHIRQFNRWPFGRWAWPLNHVLVALCYLFVLPMVWTLRARFEREAYVQSLMVDFELDGRISDARMEENAEWLATILSDDTFVYAWRKKAAYAWAMETQRKINAGEIANPTDRVEEPRAA